MGCWVDGQSEYVMVPYVDFQLLEFPDREQSLEKILDLTTLSDIFPTGYHGAISAGVATGSTVYVAGRRSRRIGGGAFRTTAGCFCADCRGFERVQVGLA